MDYFSILRRAYEITLRNRYLWIFAILAGVGGNFSSPLSNSSTISEGFPNTISSLSFEAFWVKYGQIVIIAGIVLLIIGVVWFIFSFISQGAILGAVERIEKGEQYDFWKGLRFGASKFWRVLGVAILILCLFLLSLIVLILPIIFFVVTKVYSLAIVYGIIVFILCLVFWLYLALLTPYIQRLAVLGDLPSAKAVVSSWNFFRLNWKEIVIMFLLLTVVGIALGLGLLIAIAVVGGLLAAIGYGLYLASMSIFWMYVAVFGVAFLIFIMVLSGLIGTFNSTVLTLTYLRLKKA